MEGGLTFRTSDDLAYIRRRHFCRSCPSRIFRVPFRISNLPVPQTVNFQVFPTPTFPFPTFQIFPLHVQLSGPIIQLRVPASHCRTMLRSCKSNFVLSHPIRSDQPSDLTSFLMAHPIHPTSPVPIGLYSADYPVFWFPTHLAPHLAPITPHPIHSVRTTSQLNPI